LTAGRPAEISSGVKVIKPWFFRATAARPMDVAIPIGIPNHAIPPIRKALTLVWGVLAIARCQYA